VGNYSIKELEILTGIKAHTIRIWEQRYNILAPSRTQTNIRYYTEEDLKHLLNISLLNKNGYKISRLAKMSSQEVKDSVLRLAESNFEHHNQIDSLVVAMIDFDEEGFEKIISTNILRIGFEKTFTNIVFPFLNRIGILWQTAVVRPAQEHFISNLIRQKIVVAIDGQRAVSSENNTRFLLYLPERELHELSLLFLNYIIRSRHKSSMYLGASVPLDDVFAANKLYDADYLVTVFTAYPPAEQVEAYLEGLEKEISSSCTIAISGRNALAAAPKQTEKLILFKTIEESIDFIDSLVAKTGNRKK
jgi:MerR family transcriptional regulator, light-induced transcriptional regulator